MATITYYELRNYNNGVLISKTFNLDNVDACDHAAEIQEWLEELTDQTGQLCEEWIVCDYDKVPKFFVGEFSLSDDYFEFADCEGDYDAKEAYVERFGDFDADSFQDAYCGQWNSKQEYAENLIDECYDLESLMGNLYFYFDYEKFARDLFISDYSYVDGYVFRNC